ncbi:NADH dehydrogenase [ubiquinone] (complex I), alpha subcomplex, subunit 2 [Penicillium occitanis (nom. inval.)]|nr:NADH dehydrogenase [ubiquinone] (complex I), alpha subcomplex, subunit 2 [Penicillium occitanis (nom. inval.)]PCG95795.1 hypothetical protein PENOC_075870 [Penicillium occitanis (nom. inval.)]
MSAKYAFNKSLKELRFLFCQTSSHSDATRYVPAPAAAAALYNHTTNLTLGGGHGRSFLNRAYPTMKKNNPYVPILIREASGTEPRVFARYEFGKEKQELLSGLTDKEIEEKITTLVKQTL